MQTMEFTHQTMHAQKQHNQQQQKHLKIKQEPRGQSQMLTGNQSSPNGMMNTMNPNINLNMSSPQMIGDGTQIDSNVAKVQMKSMMAHNILNMNNQSNQVNAMNSNMIGQNQVMNATMSQNGMINMVNTNHVNIDMNHIDMSCENELMHQKQQQMMRNKAMHMSGARPPPPEYKNNQIQLMGNQRIPQTNDQFPPNIRHMPTNGMHYK